MVDYRHIGKKVELRWWWFSFDLRNGRFSALRELLLGLLVFAVGVLVFCGLVMTWADAAGVM